MFTKSTSEVSLIPIKKLSKKEKFLILIFLIIIILLFNYFISFILQKNIVFNLNGSNKIYVLAKTEYIDSGVEVKLFQNDLSRYVNTTTNLDINKIGTYYIEYNFKFLFISKKLTREIYVIDDKSPEIALIGENEVVLNIGENYNEQGVIVKDNYDNDISDKVEIESNIDINKEGKYEVKYKVSDSSNNEATIIRNIIVRNSQVTTRGEVNKIVSKTINIPQNNVEKYIKEKGYKVSIGYYNIKSGNTFYYRANKLYYGASLIKILDAIYLYEKGLVNDNIEGYIKKAISRSDNLAHEYLVKHIGRQNLKNYGRSLGANNTLSGSDNFGNTTVKDQIIYLKKLYSMIKTNQTLKSYFINNYGNYLKIDGITVLHKYGYTGNYYHDVGIFLSEDPYILVILTEHGNDNYKSIIKDLSNLMYRYHLGKYEL